MLFLINNITMVMLIPMRKKKQDKLQHCGYPLRETFSPTMPKLKLLRTHFPSQLRSN